VFNPILLQRFSERAIAGTRQRVVLADTHPEEFELLVDGVRDA
jgi:hypothetical protein